MNANSEDKDAYIGSRRSVQQMSDGTAEALKKIFERAFADFADKLSGKHANCLALKSSLLAALMNVGVFAARADYNGERGSGLITEVTASKADNVKADLSQLVRLDMATEGGQQLTLKESLEAFGWAVLHTYYPGFDVGNGSYGSIEIDAANGKVVVWHTHRDETMTEL